MIMAFEFDNWHNDRHAAGGTVAEMGAGSVHSRLGLNCTAMQLHPDGDVMLHLAASMLGMHSGTA